MKYFYLTGFIFLLACSSNKNNDSNTFVYCSEGSPSSFNPQIITDGTSFNASSKPIYDRLTQFKYGTSEVVPALAKSWEISADGKEYIFHLQENVKFHSNFGFTPSRNLNADDVIFSFKRQMDKSNPYHKVGGGAYEYFYSMEMDKLIVDIIKIDEFSIKFILAKPETPFLANLAMDFASILSKEYGDYLIKQNKKENIDNEPIGTGPFIFKSYVKDTLIRFNANPDYFQGSPKIKKLVFAITPDASVRFQKLKTGECHFISYPSPTDLEDMKKNSDITVMSKAGLNVGYLAFNVLKKPFDNKMVRVALNHALNKKSYIDAIYLGQGETAKNPIPPTMWSYNDEVKEYEYDPAKAKEMLTQAGFPRGFDVELWTLPVSRPYNPNGKKMGEMMMADLAKIGVRAKLISYDWPTYLEKSKKGEHQLLQMGWTGDNGDPDNFLNVLLSCAASDAGANRAFWCNKHFDEIVNKAKSITDLSERTKLYKEAQILAKEEAPWVPIAHSITFRAMRKNVAGYEMDPLGSDNFYYVELK